MMHQPPKHHGFTLVEIMIALLLLVMILMGGTGLYYANLRMSGLSDIDLNITSAVRAILALIEKEIRFSTVVGMDAGNRTDCLAQGAGGLTGSTLTINSLEGVETQYLLDAQKIASVITSPPSTSYLNSADILIDSLQFTWFCQGGVSDKIRIDITASSPVKGIGVNATRTVSQEINLLNSGL